MKSFIFYNVMKNKLIKRQKQFIIEIDELKEQGIIR